MRMRFGQGTGRHRVRLGLSIALCAAAVLLGSTRSPGLVGGRAASRADSGTWLPAASTQRIGWEPAALRMPDGKPFVAGIDALVRHPYELWFERYDPVADQWTDVTGLFGPWYSQSVAIPLATGEVLVASAQKASVVVDLAAERVRPAGILDRTSDDPAVAGLFDGGVLLVGGVFSMASTTGDELAQRFDPRSLAWRPTGQHRIQRHGSTATLLHDGRVLVAGGRIDGEAVRIALADAVLYDPQSETWRTTMPSGSAHANHTATTLHDGRVLVVGNTAELFDPRSETWRAAPAPASPRVEHTATLLPTGRVLVAGGSADGLAELYDPERDVWLPAGHLHEARQDHAATLLPNGEVLVVGGEAMGADAWTVLSTTERYRPDFAALALDARPAILGAPATLTLTHRLEVQGIRFGADAVVELRSLATDLAAVLEQDPLVPSQGGRFVSEPVRAFPIGFAAVTLIDGGVPSPAQNVVVVACDQAGGDCRGRDAAAQVFLPITANGHVLRAGGSMIRLTSSPWPEWQPSVAPDGKRIVFVADHPDGILHELRSLDIDTGASQMILARAGGELEMPVFGPDGRSLALGTYHAEATEHLGHWGPEGWSLYLYDLSDGPLGEALHALGPLGARRAAAARRGGPRIAFDLERDGNTDVFAVDVDPIGWPLAPPVRLTVDPAADKLAAFSADGQRILFRSERDGNSEIYTMAHDGSGQTRLTADPAFDTYPSWSPDGRSILFQSDRGGRPGVYAMDGDGTNVRPIASSADADHVTPRFMPDGRWIVLASNRLGDMDLYALPFEGTGVP